MSTYTIRYEDQEFELEYVFPREVAALEGGLRGRFQELALLEELRKRGHSGVYVDAGAHIGNHSLFFSKFCPAAFVFAIEAHPTIYEVLRRNMKRNECTNVATVGPMALWRPGKDECHMGPIPGNNAGRTKVFMGGDRFAPRKDVKVPCMTLDQIVLSPDQRHDLPISVLKMDVEDSEVPAIEGAKELLDRWHPLIIAEHHNASFFNAFKEQVEPFGYKPFDKRFDPRGETVIWEPS